MNTARQLGAIVLAKCAANDPWFPNAGQAAADAWGEIFAHYEFGIPDLLEAVKLAYLENGAGFRPLPADIVKHARAVRKDRLERMSPDERRAFEDRRDAELEAKRRRLGIEDDS